MRPRSPWWRSSTSSTTPRSTRKSAPSCPRARCWWARRAPARPCWPRPWPERPTCPSSPSPAPTSWRCSWVWAPPASATCSRRPTRWPPASCSSTRSTPSASPATTAWAATTSGSRPSTSCWPRWTALTPPRASSCWPPPTGPRCWTRPCSAPAASTGASPWTGPTWPAVWPPSRCTPATSVWPRTWTSRKIALATAGTVGADLANLVNEAALRAVRLGRKAVNQEDLLAAFELVIAGSGEEGQRPHRV